MIDGDGVGSLAMYAGVGESAICPIDGDGDGLHQFPSSTGGVGDAAIALSDGVGALSRCSKMFEEVVGDALFALSSLLCAVEGVGTYLCIIPISGLKGWFSLRHQSSKKPVEHVGHFDLKNEPTYVFSQK